MSNAALVTRGVTDASGAVLRIFNYIPNRPVAGAAAAVFLITFAALAVRAVRRKDWWAWSLPIGAEIMGIGYILRIRLSDDSKDIEFAMSQVCVVCSAVAWVAFNYIIYGRLITQCIGQGHAIVKAEIVSRIFTLSSILTLIAQVAGVGLEESTDRKLRDAGHNALLGGMVAQMVIYIVFVAVLVYTHIRIVQAPATFPKTQPWWKLIWLMEFSSVFILVRHIYRIVEISQGFGGFLLTHEVYLYALDALPMFIAVVPFVFWWPGAILAQSNEVRVDSNGYKMEERADLTQHV